MMDERPRLINKKKGEKSSAPDRGRGLTVKQQQELIKAGRPDLAEAWRQPRGNWTIADERMIPISNSDPRFDDSPTVQSRDLSPYESSLFQDKTGFESQPPLSPEQIQTRQQLTKMMQERGRPYTPPAPLAPPPIQTLGGLEGGSAPTVPPMDKPIALDSPLAKVDPKGTITSAKPNRREQVGAILGMAMGAPAGGGEGGVGGFLSKMGMGAGGGGGQDDSRPMRIGKPQFDMGGVADDYISRAASGMKMFRHGGYLGEGEEGIVGEDTARPEHVYARPDGGVEITPVSPDALDRGQIVPQNPVPEQFGMDETDPAMREPVGRADLPSQPITDTTAVLDEAPLPPRKSAMDIKRWLTKDPYGSSSDAVWGARQDVATEDAYKAATKDYKGSFWKSLGVGLLQLMKNRITHQNAPVTGWKDYQRNRELSKTLPQLTMAEKVLEQRRALQDRDLKRKYDQTKIQDIIDDNAEKTLDRQRKVDDRVSRERTNRMNQVAGILKNLPEFIPGDPKFKELEDALGDVGLPVTQKDAKKKVDLKQDQRTGEWTVILTNPATGQQEVRPVMKDGKPLKTTPTVVMQGEYGMLKQNDQQAYQADENAKNRSHDRDLFLKGYEERVQRERRSNIFKAQDELQKLNKDLQEGIIDTDTYNAMVAILNAGLK